VFWRAGASVWPDSIDDAQSSVKMTNTRFSIGVDYLIVRRYLLVFFGIAAMAASALPISGTTQGTSEYRYVPNRSR
jgi:hypothetical protein